MSVKYSVVLRKNPSKIDDAGKFYAHAQAAGDLDLETICDNISHSGSVIRGDVLAVSDGLIFQMISGLKQGKIVQMGDFGHFQIQVKSNGTEDEKSFVASNITSARIQFRPGKKLKSMLKALEYSQVKKRPKRGTTPVESE